MPALTADNSNNPKYQQLTFEDVAFLDLISSRITGSGALPFELPADAFFAIVVRSLKWFWYWYPDATQDQILFIPKQSIVDAPQSGGNIDLLLPNGIEGILDWKAANGSGLGYRMDEALKIGLLNTYGSGGGGRGSGYGSSAHNVSNAVIQMYEIAQYKETFTRGIRATFNKNTRIFRLMTSIPDGLALEAATRLHPAQLYGDYMFEDYVTAAVEEQLGRIMTTFNFKMPGGVQLNYDQIASNGRDRKRELEDEIKKMSTYAGMQSK